MRFLKTVGGILGGWGTRGLSLTRSREKDSSGRTLGLGLEVSFGKRTARVWRARLITVFRTHSPTEPAPTLNWGAVEAQAGLKPRKFPPDVEGTPRCVSDAGFCFLIANPTLFWEQWNLREALLSGRLESDGETFSVAGGTAERYFSRHAITSSPFTKHSGQNEMGTNIRQLQGRSGGKPHLV